MRYKEEVEEGRESFEREQVGEVGGEGEPQFGIERDVSWTSNIAVAKGKWSMRTQPSVLLAVGYCPAQPLMKFEGIPSGLTIINLLRKKERRNQSLDQKLQSALSRPLSSQRIASSPPPVSFSREGRGAAKAGWAPANLQIREKGPFMVV